MSKTSADAPKILNVFITYKHSTGAAYIEKVRKMLDEAIEKVEGFDGYDLMYDRNVEFDYRLIDTLYNIADVDIFLISKDVDASPWTKKELQAMKARGIPVIPILFEGYEGEDIGKVINDDDGVDALPIDMTGGREPDEETVGSLARRMKQSLSRFDSRKRDKVSREIMKKAKAEENGYSISGFLIEKGKRIGKVAAEGALEGAEKFARTSSMWLVYILLVALLLAALGVALTWDDIKEILVGRLMP